MLTITLASYVQTVKQDIQETQITSAINAPQMEQMLPDYSLYS